VNQFSLGDPGGLIHFHRTRLDGATRPTSWGCYIDGEWNIPTDKAMQSRIDKILGWLNHAPPIPAVQAWLTSDYSKSMILEEFLEYTGAKQ